MIGGEKGLDRFAEDLQIGKKMCLRIEFGGRFRVSKFLMVLCLDFREVWIKIGERDWIIDGIGII